MSNAQLTPQTGCIICVRLLVRSLARSMGQYIDCCANTVSEIETERESHTSTRRSDTATALVPCAYFIRWLARIVYTPVTAQDSQAGCVSGYSI